jgi:hypothetical protein
VRHLHADTLVEKVLLEKKEKYERGTSVPFFPVFDEMVGHTTRENVHTIVLRAKSPGAPASDADLRLLVFGGGMEHPGGWIHIPPR